MSCSSQYPRLVTPIRLMDHAGKPLRPQRSPAPRNETATATPAHGGVDGRVSGSARIQFDDHRFVDLGAEFVAVRRLLEDAFELGRVDRYPRGHADRFGQL